MKHRFLIVFLLAIFAVAQTKAQRVEKNSEIGELLRIAAAAQDIPYLSFHIMTIVEDSAGSPELSLQKDTILGQFKLAGDRYWAMLDSVEYVQGYNYNLAIYHGEQLISVSKPSLTHPALQLSVLDSSFQQAHVQDMAIYPLDSVRRIFKMQFYPESPYSGYEMVYNRNTYQVYTITYYLKNGYTRSDESTRTAKITTTIFNYSTAEFSRDYFLEDKYIFKSVNGLSVRGAYEGYQLIKTREDL